MGRTVSPRVVGLTDASHTVSDLALPNKKPRVQWKVFPGVFSAGTKQLQTAVTDSASTKQLNPDSHVSCENECCQQP